MIDDQIKSLIENNPHYTRDNRRITKDRCKSFTHTHTHLVISARYLGTSQFKQ